MLLINSIRRGVQGSHKGNFLPLSWEASRVRQPTATIQAAFRYWGIPEFHAWVIQSKQLRSTCSTNVLD